MIKVKALRNYVHRHGNTLVKFKKDNSYELPMLIGNLLIRRKIASAEIVDVDLQDTIAAIASNKKKLEVSRKKV